MLPERTSVAGFNKQAYRGPTAISQLRDGMKNGLLEGMDDLKYLAERR